MIRKVLAMVAIALTAMLLLPPEPADARRGGGFRGGGGVAFRGGGGFRGGGFRVAPIARPAFRAGPVYVRPRYVYRRPVRRVVVAPAFYGVSRGGCEWLRHRAVVTGSPYWWRRYYLCRGY